MDRQGAVRGRFLPYFYYHNSQGLKVELFFSIFSGSCPSGMEQHEDHHSLSLYNGQIFRKSHPPLQNFLKKKETGRWAKASMKYFGFERAEQED